MFGLLNRAAPLKVSEQGMGLIAGRGGCGCSVSGGAMVEGGGAVV